MGADVDGPGLVEGRSDGPVSPSIPVQSFYTNESTLSTVPSHTSKPVAVGISKSTQRSSNSQSASSIIAIEPGEEQAVSLSRAGQRALSTVSPYIQSLSALLLKNLKRPNAETGMDSIIAQRLTKMEQKQDLILKKLEYIEKRVGVLSTSQGAIALGDNDSSVHHSSNQSGLLTADSSQDINPECQYLKPIPVAGISPPNDITLLTREQLCTVRIYSSSPCNFAVNLYRLALDPSDRVKMSCSGIRKGGGKLAKLQIPPEILRAILQFTSQEYSHSAEEKEIRTALDSEGRVLAYNARKCWTTHKCQSCRGNQAPLEETSTMEKENSPFGDRATSTSSLPAVPSSAASTSTAVSNQTLESIPKSHPISTSSSIAAHSPAFPGGLEATSGPPPYSTPKRSRIASTTEFFSPSSFLNFSP